MIKIHGTQGRKVGPRLVVYVEGKESIKEWFFAAALRKARPPFFISDFVLKHRNRPGIK